MYYLYNLMKKTEFSSQDHKWMRAALRLAASAKGRTCPNPAVGAVLVKSGKIIGRGRTQACGEDHAEIQALKQAGKKSAGADMYVTLEPCCHHGRTPPCTDAIIQSGVRRIVCGLKDPNPLVNGKGFRKLRKAGVPVETGLLQADAARINEDYIKFITTGKPFVILKIAQTLDGYIAAYTGDSKWITSEKSRREAHQLRAHHSAILTGIETVLHDDPLLNVRHVDGCDPARIILDSRNRLPADSAIAKSAARIRTITACAAKPRKPLPNIEYWVIPKRKTGISIPALLRKAGKENLKSVLVEAGSQVCSSFFNAQTIDKLVIFTGNQMIGNGKNAFSGSGFSRIAQAVKLRDITYKRMGDNMMMTGYPVFNVKS